jgi:hypothetical protein
MVEYTRIDASALLTLAVLITFAVLTASLIARILGNVSLLRIQINAPAVAGEPPRVGEVALIDLSRLDDDGGRVQQAPAQTAGRSDGGLPLHLPIPVASIPPVRGHGFDTPMIPGAREPGMLTTFGVVAALIPDWPKTMDAATTAARQREGGGAPSERRRPRQGSTWTRLTQRLHALRGVGRT